ncbi:MAG: hypothetical protein WC650_01215 [Candidatus Doudnabacteria bacterium]
MKDHKGLFGKYNPIADLSVHTILSFGISIWLIVFQFPLVYFVACFLAGLLLDMDHFLNGVIARLLRVKSHESSLMYGSGGCVIKIAHGFDISFLFGLLCFSITSDPVFVLLIFMSLCAHEFWDFVVYPHTWRELFLFTRIRKGFYPGHRKKFIGRIFDYKTLKF